MLESFPVKKLKWTKNIVCAPRLSRSVWVIKERKTKQQYFTSQSVSQSVSPSTTGVASTVGTELQDHNSFECLIMTLWKHEILWNFHYIFYLLGRVWAKVWFVGNFYKAESKINHICRGSLIHGKNIILPDLYWNTTNPMWANILGFLLKWEFYF